MEEKIDTLKPNLNNPRRNRKQITWSTPTPNSQYQNGWGGPEDIMEFTIEEIQLRIVNTHDQVASSERK